MLNEMQNECMQVLSNVLILFQDFFGEKVFFENDVNQLSDSKSIDIILIILFKLCLKLDVEY